MDNPVLGWDFMRFHQLDLRWGEWGDLYLYDRKAKIRGLCHIKSVPKHVSIKHQSLAVVKIEENKNSSLPFQLAALEEITGESVEIDVEEEDIEKLPDSEFKDLLRKYPELLTQTFSDEKTKNNISHRILTGDAKPCKAKTRRLLPGSPKRLKPRRLSCNLSSWVL